ncbi:MAG TPA: LytR C-terminal domain-containing protein [Longimicrobiaceae bacterium]|nr:LytR C-terminal domain-containing protein [Longimicrobiaceae bacterium]
MDRKSRFQTYGLAATILAVVGLVVSLVMGLGAGGAPDPGAARSVSGKPAERIRVEVLNASGIPGLARAATRTLRDRGYDVVYFGNARGFSRDTSLVIDRVGREGVARQVAEAIGVGRVRSHPDSTLLLEVTVVLGRDWRGARRAREADSAGAP